MSKYRKAERKRPTRGNWGVDTRQVVERAIAASKDRDGKWYDDSPEAT